MGSAQTTLRQPHVEGARRSPGIIPWRAAEQHVGITADELHNYNVQEEARERLEEAVCDFSAAYRSCPGQPASDQEEDAMLALLNDAMGPNFPGLTWEE